MRKILLALAVTAMASLAGAAEQVQIVGIVKTTPATGSTTTVTLAGSTTTVNQGGTWTIQPGNVQNTTAWLVTSTGSLVQGMAATAAAVAGNPVYIGVRSSSTTPTALVASGQAVPLWGDWSGRLVVVNGSPSPQDPRTVQATASGQTVVVSSPGANVSLYINKIMMCNSGATDSVVSLLPGGAGTTVFKAVVANSGGCTAAVFGPRGWKLAANTQLTASLSATTTIDINVMEYYIDP